MLSLRQQLPGAQSQVATLGSEALAVVASPSSSSGPTSRPVLAVDRLVYTEADYEKLDQKALVSLLLRRDDTIKTLRADLAESNAKRRRLDARLEAARKTLALPDDPNGAFTIVRQGQKQKWISKPSQIAIALRRNITNASASDFGVAIMEDTSHQSVTRYEIDAAWHHQVVCKMWHSGMDASVLAMAEETGKIAIETHAFRCDATNSSIWLQSKLHGLELTSSFLFSFEKATVRQGLLPILTGRWRPSQDARAQNG